MSCDLKKTAWSFLFDAKSIVRKGDFTYQNPAVLMEFAERSAAMAQKILTDGIPDYNTLETKAPGLKKIIEKTFESELKKGKLVDIEALNAYLTAGSSLVRQNLGHLSNVPTDAALKLINDGSNYARAAREIGGFLDEYLDRKVERGLWSKEGSSASREKYAEFYAPLKRVVDVVF